MFIYVRIFPKVSLFSKIIYFKRKKIKTTNKTFPLTAIASIKRAAESVFYCYCYFPRWLPERKSKMRRLCCGWLKYGSRFTFHSIRSQRINDQIITAAQHEVRGKFTSISSMLCLAWHVWKLFSPEHLSAGYGMGNQC